MYEYTFYVGTYTSAGGLGIYALKFDASRGELRPLGLAAEVVDPSFLAIDPAGMLLFSVSETGDFENRATGSLLAYHINRNTGHLSLANEVASLGADPCHLSLDRTSQHLLVANYQGGTVAIFPSLPDGRLGPPSEHLRHPVSHVDPSHPKAPHPHAISASPDNRYVLVADLGLDKVFVYRFDSNDGTLLPNYPPAITMKLGSGPRHFAFHPNGQFLYVIGELDSTVTVLSWKHETADFKILQTISTLPAGFIGASYAAQVQVHPRGQFLFVSNRGADTIAAFTVNKTNGNLTSIGHASAETSKPNGLALDPSGRYLLVAYENSNCVTAWSIDLSTGELRQCCRPVTVPSPVHIAFLPR